MTEGEGLADERAGSDVGRSAVRRGRLDEVKLGSSALPAVGRTDDASEGGAGRWVWKLVPMSGIVREVEAVLVVVVVVVVAVVLLRWMGDSVVFFSFLLLRTKIDISWRPS